MSQLKTDDRPRAATTVQGVVNYTGEMTERARYFANDHSRDNLVLEPHAMPIVDARRRADPPSLEREGFQLFDHVSAVSSFRDPEEVARLHPAEIEQLLLRVSGADRVVVSGGGVLRFGESAPESGVYNNSRPARFIHIDISDPTAVQFSERSRPKDEPGKVRRYAHYNVWRVISPPPQDIPLAVCDARSLSPEDLVAADAVFDVAGQPDWSFEGLIIRHNPKHRWSYFSDMTRDEALVFKTNDSDPGQPHHIPHSAFDDPSCPPGVPTRASIEMRGIAYWFE